MTEKYVVITIAMKMRIEYIQFNSMSLLLRGIQYHTTPNALGRLRSIHTERLRRRNRNVDGGTFHLFDGQCDSQNGLHINYPFCLSTFI